MSFTINFFKTLKEVEFRIININLLLYYNCMKENFETFVFVLKKGFDIFEHFA